MLSFTGFAQQAKTYDEAIIMGDKFYKESQLLDAKAYYQMALKFKSNDAYSKGRIKTIVEQLSSQSEREDRYLEIVEEADAFFKKNQLDEALDKYSKALAVIPDDDYAQMRIEKINDIKINQAEKLAEFEKLMADGKQFVEQNKFDEAIVDFKKASKVFPDNQEPVQLIEETKKQKEEYLAKKAVFDEEVELANRYSAIKNYIETLKHLKLAFDIFPDNWAVENEIKKYEPLAAKQEEYNKQVEKADELYMNKNYASAKELYNNAAEIWPENNYPGDMVMKIDEQLKEQMANLDANYNKSIRSADSLFKIEELETAAAEYNFCLSLKPNEAYPKSQLKKIDKFYLQRRAQLEEEYSSIVASADSSFIVRDFAGAKTTYELALSIRPNEAHPAMQLLEIEKLQAEIAAKAEQQSKYDALVAEALAKLQEEEYQEAIDKYREAAGVMDDNGFAAERIDEIEVVIGNLAMQKEIDAKYETTMAFARRLFEENNLKDARKSFEEATALKPLEEEPKTSIEKIDSLLLAQMQQQQIEEEYQAALNKGDSLLGAKQFDESIIAFNAAIAVKPGDAFAMNKLETVKAEQKKYQLALDAQTAYDNAIREADSYLNDKKYADAKSSYQQALQAKPEQTYPANKILEINGILERIAAENTRKYNEAIAKADTYFDASNLSEALVQYKIASSFKPEEAYPKDRIAESNSLIEEKLRLVRNEYSLAIADADKLYAAKIYDKAIAAYQRADKIFPEKNYPEEMIAKITNLIEENAIVDVISQKINIGANTTEKINFEPVRINVRKSNYILVKATNTSGKAFKIIFGYGSDKGKNGGFVVQVPTGNEQNDYIIRVGNQYKWFSEDNNWLSVYPENGDIEISLLRISTSD